MNQVTTGRSTSAPLERNTITTAGQRCPSGRSPKNGWRGDYNLFIQTTWLYTLYFNQCQAKPDRQILDSWLILFASYLYLWFTENRGKKRQQKLRLSTVSPKTGTTEERLCKLRQPLALLLLVSVTTHILYPPQSAPTDHHESHVCIFWCLVWLAQNIKDECFPSLSPSSYKSTWKPLS